MRKKQKISKFDAKPDVKIVVPVYNEEKTIGKLLEKMKKLGWIKQIICVNDGSQDKSAEIIKKYPVTYLEHAINRGLGGALRTGIEAGIILNAKIIVTMDADLQHKPEEIKQIIQPILEKKADVVIGTRIQDKKGMPLIRRIANIIGNLVTRVLFSINVSDSQSGFRAFSNKAAKKLVLKTNRMEISSEIVSQIKRQNLKLIEIPITAIYSNYSMSKGQGFKTGIKTMLKLMIARFK